MGEIPANVEYSNLPLVDSPRPHPTKIANPNTPRFHILISQLQGVAGRQTGE